MPKNNKLLDNIPNQPPKFRTKDWVKIDCVADTGTAAVSNDNNKEVIFKNCAPFTDCISVINTQIDNAKEILYFL